jgi:hypothetical protein
LKDPLHKKKLNDILLEHIDDVQAADKKMECFVFHHPSGYVNIRNYLYRIPTLTLAKHVPNMITQLMKKYAT